MNTTEETTDKCTHHSCNCPTLDKGNYCGDHCRTADPLESPCACGHPECRLAPQLSE